jgi:hypothetical protein
MMKLLAFLSTLVVSFHPVRCQQTGEQCCPSGFAGLRGFSECSAFYICSDGVVSSAPIPCGFGFLFAATSQSCEIAENVSVCEVDLCVPGIAPVTTPIAPIPTTKSPIKSRIAAPTPPTIAPEQCCPDGYTGKRAWDDCRR